MQAETFLDLYPDLCVELQRYHSLFYQLSIVGEPIITESIPTAAITFNEEGEHLNFLFNPKFLEELNWTEIKFVCCHEMLHILLNHGIRIKGMKLNRKIANIAMDLVINHALVDNFGFLRSDLPNLDNPDFEKDKASMQWRDITFKYKEKLGKKELILPDRNYEYYFNKLVEDAETEYVKMMQEGLNGGTLDDHDSLPDLTKEEMQKVLGKALGDEEKAKDLVDQLEKFNNKQAGIGEGKDIFNSIFKYIRKKKKWEDVVAKIRKTKLGLDAKEEYQWVKPHRRFNLLPTDMMMPTENDIDDEPPSKWEMWLFQDVSGSCISYFDRFFKAALTIPKDVFNIKFHVFDDGVREVSLKDGKFRGGGGTSFTRIEDYIQNQVKKGKKYPKLVFIITDGCGNKVNPQFSERWYWFLTENYRECIPATSKTFLLKDFEK